jgi:hypothetical protein
MTIQLRDEANLFWNCCSVGSDRVTFLLNLHRYGVPILSKFLRTHLFALLNRLKLHFAV